jgi:hypothetical protein
MQIKVSALGPGARFRTLLTRAEGEVRSDPMYWADGTPYASEGPLVWIQYKTGAPVAKRLHPDVRVEVDTDWVENQPNGRIEL